MIQAVVESSEGSHTQVDPELLAVIGSAGAPTTAPKPATPPDTMPGTLAPSEAVMSLFGNLFRGIAYADANRAKYGDVYRAPFIGLPMVVVWDADTVHRILRNEDQAWSTALGWDTLMFQGLDPRPGNPGTLLSFDFDDHKLARKLVQPAFTLRAIEGYLGIAQRGFAPEIARWVSQRRVRFKADVRTVLARTASEIFTGIEDPVVIAEVDRALSEFWNGMMAAFKDPRLSPTFRRSQRGLARLLDTFMALVPERRARGGDDLFSRMCQLDTEGLGDDGMLRIFLTVMFGAFDTTSAAMTSMAYLLATNPEWQDRLREEAREVSPDGPPDTTAMRAMKQHDWVWKETLRLMPVTGFVPRRALRDVVLGGHHVRAGTLVMPMNGGVGRHPDWWTEPTRFDPSRFAPERAEDRRHPGIFAPFGAGAHACVGMQLATMEMKLFFHQFLSAARFRLARPYEARHTFTPMGMVSGDVDLLLGPARPA